MLKFFEIQYYRKTSSKSLFGLYLRSLKYFDISWSILYEIGIVFGVFVRQNLPEYVKTYQNTSKYTNTLPPLFFLIRAEKSPVRDPGVREAQRRHLPPQRAARVVASLGASQLVREARRRGDPAGSKPRPNGIRQNFPRRGFGWARR